MKGTASSPRRPDFASVPIPEVLATLRVNPKSGLSEAEASSRLQVAGPNEVPLQRVHPAVQFLKKFWSPSAWMLELILILSALLGKYPDIIVVGGLLVVNAVISFVQERRADGVVDSLRRRLHITARVLRDGGWRILPARELVPGDILRIRSGDFIPADLKLLTGELRVDQSALTGESQEARKAPGNVLVSGSVVRRGEADGLVILTGANTYYGRTTELVQTARPKLHIEAVVAWIVRRLFVIVGSLLVLIGVLSFLRGLPLPELAPLLLVLLMSAVPVALPVMFTVSMAAGSRELAKRGVLVTRLGAAEDAASMDVLCVDKTGTITMNRLAVGGVIPLGRSSEEDVLRTAALASQEADLDPIDRTFLDAAKERNLFAGMPSFRKVSFLPFDAERRRTEAVVEQNGRRLRVMKGALRTVAGLCELPPAECEALEERVRDPARKGFRILAVAGGPEGDLPELIGLATLYDPPRPEAGRLIRSLRGTGVSVKMLTGDEQAVAEEIAREVGLIRIRRMADLKAVEGSADGGEANLLAEMDGLAEVYPEDKYTVVRRLQADGHIAGMTGDGVNDAPSLRQAEVGIAVSTATDVAKGAASVVLTEPGLTNILTLVEQGRTIYQRILTWIINKISRTVLKAGFVSIAFVLTGRFVISAFAMLLLVFMNDFAKIALAYDRVRPSQKPETWKIEGLVAVSAVLGLAMVAEALLLLWAGWSRFGLESAPDALPTFSFLTLLYFAVFSILSARERRWFGATAPSPVLLGALAADALTGTVLTFAGLPGLPALPVWQVGVIFLYAMLSCLLVNDTAKTAMLKKIGAASA